MTNEQIIKELKWVLEAPKSRIVIESNKAIIYTAAIQALEKQIPKKPIESQYNGINGVPYKKCPNCDSVAWGGGLLDRKTKNCEDCGQKLDWEG